PAFQAINLEPEENIDEQIDTTKEVHVDEALKRFQTALKLHAQGQPSREAAAAAYDELFESEIFKYREARTDYERAERQANGEVDSQGLEAFPAGLDIDAGGADGVATTLSLALYLGYKNYGEFFLDKLKDLRYSDPNWKKRRRIYGDEGGDKVLDYWAKALDQDPSDPEVWRRAGRFAASMNSARLKRFCLEAAIELDDDPATTEVEPPSLAEGLAGGQLKSQLELLDDKIALSHPAMLPWVEKNIPELMKRLMDPIPFLPDPTQSLTPPPSSPPRDQKLLENEEEENDADPVCSWADLGEELMKHIDDLTASVIECGAEPDPPSPDREMTPQNGETGDADKGTSATQEKEATGPSKDKNGTKEGDGKKENGTDSGKQKVDKTEDKAQNDRGSSAPTTRKRSQSTAGIPEAVDEESVREKRSKRVRRRETVDASESVAPGASIASQLQPFQEADHNLFQATRNILENLGVEDKETIQRLTELQESSTSEDRMSGLTPLASKDLRAVVSTFSQETARVLTSKEEKPSLGLSSFLEHAKSGSQDQAKGTPFNEAKGLRAFVDRINANTSWMTGGDAAFEWIRAVSKSYTKVKWPDEMKATVIQMLSRFHCGLLQRVTDEIEYSQASPERLEDLSTLVPMLFELCMDIYDDIIDPASVAGYATRIETKDRLSRWLNVTSTYVSLLDRPASDPICVRFMWASVVAASHAEDPVREHMLLMWTSLRDFMSTEKTEPITLPNSNVMPIVSAEAADREISRLTTMDFFIGLFQDEMENPVHVIETLEPVLNPSSVRVMAEDSPRSSVDADGEKATKETTEDGEPLSECAGQGLRDLWKFLLNSSTELRLFLWSQLGIAYEAIDYKTKKFSCHLRSIEMIVADLDGEAYTKTPDDSRKLLLLRTLRSLDEQLVQALSMAINEPTAFDIIDGDHFRSTAAALAKVNCLLHVASLCEDEVRVGISASPASPNNSTFQAMSNKLREMQVRAWTLHYTLMDAAIEQHGSFISPDNEKANYLSAVHRVIGLRKFCKVSNKIFLNLMRRELLRMKDLDHWEDYLEQVLYDLYGLKLGVGAFGVQEHGCPHETLQKSKAIQLVERVMVLAKRMSVKDLLKSELKTTIDHMQQAIGQLKSNAQMIHNLRNFTEYLKKPIHPLRLYRALTGGVYLDAVNVPPRSDAVLANHGWFFLLGMIALTKFKGVDLNRRQTPGATDDLRIGATLLRLQLQFTPDRWDAWFRLAECFDYELDEAVLWTAERINKDRAELLRFQRGAIHCYTLALSHSHIVDIEEYDGDPLHDLYQRFGMRMYSSSRQPFAMEPFQHSEQERFFIEATGQGTFKRIVHDELPQYKVWKYAARLFKMAAKRQPNNWKNSYMLAKCYWKMFTADADQMDATDRDSHITASTLLEVLKKSVEVAYNARKSRRSEPILEPHYKIVSIVHKMVMRGDLQAKEAAKTLSEQPFGVSIKEDDEFASFDKPEDWDEYIIASLENLADKDKSNWQHRIIMRHATILFKDDDNATTNNNKTSSDGVGEEGDSNDDGDEKQGQKPSEEVWESARDAFDILGDSMLTKTMVMNVWKCDAERPGRHHVYTERYTRFVVRLLGILSDRFNMEQLLKRIRKKGADFYHFLDLWQWCCHEFVKLLRRIYEIPEATEEVFKSMSAEEFDIVSGRITDWAVPEGPHTAVFSCMRDVIELKKLNGGLTRAGPIDDLINDCYSKIYLDIGDSLPGTEPAKVIEERHKAKEAEEAAAAEAAATAAAAEQEERKPANNALQSLLNPIDTQDANDSSRRATPTPQESEKPEAGGTRARRTGIRRPDVLRKAEQAVMRSMEQPKAGPAAKTRTSSKRGSQTPVAAMSEDNAGGAAGAESGSDGEEEDGPDAQVRREAGETEAKGTPTPPGNVDAAADTTTVHLGSDDENDGDDESDLSDAPDASDGEMPPGLMFPNLRRGDADDQQTSGEDAGSESEGEEDEEAEEETKLEAHEGQEADEEGRGHGQDEGLREEEDEEEEVEADVTHGNVADDEEEDDEENEGQEDTEMADADETADGSTVRVHPEEDESTMERDDE
ncbi:regulatory protein, partial [Geosmithia morbida]